MLVDKENLVQRIDLLSQMFNTTQTRGITKIIGNYNTRIQTLKIQDNQGICIETGLRLQNQWQIFRCPHIHFLILARRY